MGEGASAALITGASVGIGRELALVFARHGFDLVLTARDEARLCAVAAESTAAGAGRVQVLPGDLSVPTWPRALFERLQGDGTRIDVLVNNAGFGSHGPFAETDLDTDLRLLQVNIVALTELTKLFLRPMLARGSGRILNVASVAGFQPGPLMATYYASKAYVLHFTEAVAQEVAGRGVTVTALCPGPVRTEFGQRAGVSGTRPFRSRAMEPGPVAEAGYRGLMRGRRVVIPGWDNKILARLNRLSPRRFTTWVTGKLNEVH